MGSAWHEDPALYRPRHAGAVCWRWSWPPPAAAIERQFPPPGEGTAAAADTAAAPATPAPGRYRRPWRRQVGGCRHGRLARRYQQRNPQASGDPAVEACRGSGAEAGPEAAGRSPPQRRRYTRHGQTQAAPQPAPAAQDSPPAAQGGGDQPLRDAYHQAPRDTVDQVTYNGWKQYNLNCARCHGEDVLGTTIAPHLIMSLKPDGPINTKELFVQTVCAGRPEKGMPSWCALGMDPAKINEIYAYVHGRSEAKIGPGRPAVKEGS